MKPESRLQIWKSSLTEEKGSEVGLVKKVKIVLKTISGATYASKNTKGVLGTPL